MHKQIVTQTLVISHRCTRSHSSSDNYDHMGNPPCPESKTKNMQLWQPGTCAYVSQNQASLIRQPHSGVALKNSGNGKSLPTGQAFVQSVHLIHIMWKEKQQVWWPMGKDSNPEVHTDQGLVRFWIMPSSKTQRPEEVLAEDKGYLERTIEKAHDEYHSPAPRPAAEARAII